MKTLELDQMESVQAGDGCGWSLFFFGAAFVGAAMATGGASIVVGLIGVGGGIRSVINSC